MWWCGDCSCHRAGEAPLACQAGVDPGGNCTGGSKRCQKHSFAVKCLSGSNNSDDSLILPKAANALSDRQAWQQAHAACFGNK